MASEKIRIVVAPSPWNLGYMAACVPWPIERPEGYSDPEWAEWQDGYRQAQRKLRTG